MSDKTPERGPFQGVRQIFDFNWPFYAASLAVATVTVAALRRRRWPRSLERLGWMGCGSALWWTAASLAASHWVYDRSRLMKWHWIADTLPASPRRWANIHCGLDESTLALHALFPESTGLTFDIFCAAEMTEPAIYRARQEAPPVAAIAAAYSALPLVDGALDTVFLLFAAHELRTAHARERFFGEIARVLAPGGRVLLAEHARDAANFVAFGPGFWHFWPSREWRRLAQLTGLKIEQEFTLTPLVRVWVLEKVPQHSD